MVLQSRNGDVVAIHLSNVLDLNASKAYKDKYGPVTNVPNALSGLLRRGRFVIRHFQNLGR
jgi:hypothetical protein